MRSVLVTILLCPSIALSQSPAKDGVITGQLRIVNGDPAVGVRVAAVPADDPVGLTLLSLAETDEAGRFRLDNVPPGVYRILAGAIGAPTYYPGTIEPRLATTVRVRSGAIVEDIRFNVTSTVRLPVGRIRYSAEGNTAMIEFGRQTTWVFDPKFPVVSGRVIVEGVSPGALLPRIPVVIGTSRVLSSGNGTFVPAVEFFPSTDVWVSVPMEGGGFGDYYVKSIVYGSIDLLKDPLKLDTTTSENITITLAIGSRVAGNVRRENGEPANISVYLIPRTPVAERPDLPRWTNTDAQGNFVLRGVAPGDYDIFSESMLDSSRNAVRVTVDANPIPSLNLTLDSRRSLLTR